MCKAVTECEWTESATNCHWKDHVEFTLTRGYIDGCYWTGVFTHISLTILGTCCVGYLGDLSVESNAFKCSQHSEPWNDMFTAVEHHSNINMAWYVWITAAIWHIVCKWLKSQNPSWPVCQSVRLFCGGLGSVACQHQRQQTISWRFERVDVTSQCE